MQNVPVSRPLTQDFALSAITAVGGTVTSAVVSELTDETFFAKVVVDVDGRQVEIDSRPSDAVAVAIRAKVPIYVDDAVMDQAGMTFDPDAPPPAAPEPDPVADESGTRAARSERPEERSYLPGAEPAGGSSVAVALDGLGILTEGIRRQIAVLLTLPPPTEGAPSPEQDEGGAPAEDQP